tara:strand:+ start:328 stop:522 length:195 start_codon:yes stop_codon:yes gene_type:complete
MPEFIYIVFTIISGAILFNVFEYIPTKDSNNDYQQVLLEEHTNSSKLEDIEQRIDNYISEQEWK